MQVTDILSAVLVGLVIGILGRLVIPGRQRIGVFVTLLIGVGAAVLGTLVASSVKLPTAPVTVIGVSWDWIVLAIQVGFAAIGTALAAAVTHTIIARNDPKPRKVRAKVRKD